MVAVLTALAMVGCNANLVEPIQGSKDVTFHVYEQEAMTRAALDVKSGVGASVATQTKTITVPTSNIGKMNCTFGSYVLLPNGVKEVNIFFVFKDDNGASIAEHDFLDVSMETNYITRYTGNVFSGDLSSRVTVQNEWSGEKEYGF